MGRRRRDDDDYQSYETPWLRRVLDDAFGTLGATVMGALRGVGLFVFLFITAPLRWMGFLQTSLDDERSKERTSNALLGAPAAVAGVALAVLVFMVATTPASTLSGRYRTAAKKALDDGDTNTALLYYTRLRSFDSGNPESTYELAQLYEKTGRRDLARTLMMQIAPTDRLGYPMAHAWLASQLISGRSSPQEIEVARTHLLRLLQLSPGHPQANTLMAQLDIRSGRYVEAEQRLRTAAVNYPVARLMLSRVLLKTLNRAADGKAEAEEARRHFEGEVRRKPDEHQSRDALAESLLLLGDYARAAALLKEGESLFPKANYNEKLALLYAEWAANLPRGDARRWPLFADAFKIGNPNPIVLGTMLKASLADKADELSLRAMLDPFRQTKDAHAAAAELLLGLLSVHRGKTGEATVYLKRAGDIEPKSPSLGAMTIEAARLERATLVDLTAALKNAWPERPDLRRFHGIALAAAGRMAEALVELEQLVNEGHRDAALFDTLAEVTARLGLQAKSEQYRKQAKELSPVAEAKQAAKEQAP